jgi:hypothetical protein
VRFDAVPGKGDVMIAPSMIVALGLGVLAAFGPLFVALAPPVAPGLLYRLSALRRALAVASLLVAIFTARGRHVRTSWLGLLGTGVLATVSQVLKPERVFVALNFPPHVRPAEADLGDEAIVLGYARDDQACAWPLEIVAPHHLINDRVGSMPVLASY